MATPAASEARMQLRSGRLLHSDTATDGAQRQDAENPSAPPDYEQESDHDSEVQLRYRKQPTGMYPSIPKMVTDIDDLEQCIESQQRQHQRQVDSAEHQISVLRQQLDIRDRQLNDLFKENQDQACAMRSEFNDQIARLSSQYDQDLASARSNLEQLIQTHQSANTIRPSLMLNSPPRQVRRLPQTPPVKISDSLIAPKPFSGHDSEPEDFLRHFERFSALKSLNEAEKIQVFSLFLTSVALDWWNTLSPDKITSWATVEREFRNMFAKPAILRYQQASSLFLSPQQATERVDVFITRLKKDAARLNIPDQMLLYAILNGLRGPIRTHCLTQNCQTLEQIIHAARVAEASAAGDPVSEILMSALRSTTAAAVKQEADIKTLTDKVAALEAPRPTQDMRSPVATGSQSAQIVNALQPQQQSQQVTPRPWHSNVQKGRGGSTFRGGSRPTFNPRQQQRQHYGERQVQQQQQYRPVDRSQTQQQRVCYRCGASHEPPCRFVNQSCFNCGKTGHSSRVCRSAAKPSQQ